MGWMILTLVDEWLKLLNDGWMRNDEWWMMNNEWENLLCDEWWMIRWMND